MLWLPLPAAAALSASGGNFLADYIPMLVGGLVFWIPYWLAWWLSDGFKGMLKWPGIGAPFYVVYDFRDDNYKGGSCDNYMDGYY